MSVAATDIKWTKYIPHVPHVKQHAYLWLDCKESMFGGAAGGGKSDALLMAALQYVDVPGYSAIIFRRTFADLSLPGAIMSRSTEWLANTDAKWNENKKTWRFPSGATLTFGYMEHEKHKFRYQSSEFQFIGFDELTQFPEADYLYLFSRCRKPKMPDEDGTEYTAHLRDVIGALAAVPLRVRGATNPGGEGHKWVSARFLDKVPDEPNEDTPEELERVHIEAQERIFISSKLEDNPSLDMAEYEKSLNALDPITRAQLRHGDWFIRPPGMWVFDSEHIAAAFELGKRYDKMREDGELVEPHGGGMRSGMDYGDFATIMLPGWSLEQGGMYVPPTMMQMSREDLVDIAEGGLEVMEHFPFWWKVHYYDASFAQSNRTFVRLIEKKLGMHNALRQIGRPNSVPVSFKEYKLLCVRYIRLLLENSFKAVNGGALEARVLAISPRNRLLKEQMEEYQEDEFGKFEKGDDDAVDALIALVQPDARTHRMLIEQMQERAKKGLAKKQPTARPDVPPMLRRQQA